LSGSAAVNTTAVATSGGENSNIVGSSIDTGSSPTTGLEQLAPPPGDDLLPIIIGASVGGFCCLLLTILLIVWLVRRRRSSAESKKESQEYFQSSGAVEMSEPIKRGSLDDGTLVLSNSTSGMTMNRQQIYASAPNIAPTKEYGTSTSIVYDAAPPLQTQHIYGAAPPVALNASGGEYGAAPPEATSYGGMPATVTSNFGNTTYYERIGHVESEESADTSRSSA
jgi:hypothetical protein